MALLPLSPEDEIRRPRLQGSIIDDPAVQPIFPKRAIPSLIAAIRTLRLELPCLPPAEYGANRSRGAAWQRQFRVSRGRRGAIEQVVALVKEQGWQGPPMDQAQVTVKFYLPDKRRRDGLALWERVKPWMDGLVVAGVLKDDDLLTIGFPVATWEYRARRPGTVIDVDETRGSW